MSRALVLLVSLVMVAAASWAAPPNQQVLDACLKGESQGTTKVEGIPFDVREEDEGFWRGYSAITTVFRKTRLGYAKKGDEQGIVLGRRVYPLSGAGLINVERERYREQLAQGLVDLAQPADWYWVSDKRRGRFLCVVTGRSMERAATTLFLLSVTLPVRAYVYEGSGE